MGGKGWEENSMRRSGRKPVGTEGGNEAEGGVEDRMRSDGVQP